MELLATNKTVSWKTQARYSKKGVKKIVQKIQEFSEHMNNESNLLQGNDDMIDGTTQGNRDDKIEDLYMDETKDLILKL